MAAVGLVQSLIGHVEGVRILHREFAATQHTSAGALLIAVLGLNLIQRDREILIGGVHILDRAGKHFLVGRAKQHICVLAVLEAEEVIAVFHPAVGLLIRLARQQSRKQHFLAADGVHFLTDYIFNLAQGAQTQRQPGIHARRDAAYITGAYEQLVAGDLGIGGVLTKGTEK